VPYSQILGLSSKLNRPNVQFKLVPSSFEEMVGALALEAPDEIPLIDIAYGPRRVWDHLAKRFFDRRNNTLPRNTTEHQG
jgi:hypothetical protein